MKKWYQRRKLNSAEAARFLLDSGLLFDINRQILHPIGLALAVGIDDEGRTHFDGLIDSDDPEGYSFGPADFKEGKKKLRKFYKDFKVQYRLRTHARNLGPILQMTARYP
jgi:hypothetical protein